MIGIIDYGVGNIKAFSNIYKNLNIDFKIVSSISDFKHVTKIILPGVGSFDHAINSLNNSGMRDKLDKLVLEDKIPVLGICVGLQMLANSSEEGNSKGLGWIKGKVKKIDISNELKNKFPLPHMGWNNMSDIKNNKLFNGLENGSRFYFLHSYFIECENEDNIIGYSDYVRKFACAVNKDNIYGIQQHPEKSHKNGITILKNFGEI